MDKTTMKWGALGVAGLIGTGFLFWLVGVVASWIGKNQELIVQSLLIALGIVLGAALFLWMGWSAARSIIFNTRWYQKKLYRQLQQERRTRLLASFDHGTVDRILAGEFWVGQSEKALLESLGEPEGKNEKRGKTGVLEEWLYQPLSPQRFALKVTLEDGLVTHTDKKDDWAGSVMAERLV
jgi:hypothetical protein